MSDGSTARLGLLERAVMDQLWATRGKPRAVQSGSVEPGLTVKDVHLGLARTRDIAYTTVLTVLDRLAKKGLVDRERDGRAWRYRPVASREELTARAMRQPLGALDGVDRRAALLHLLDTVSAEELDDLKAALAEVEARTARTARG
jgi:BlaI family transcriptional regulator, penicillinase repressor